MRGGMSALVSSFVIEILPSQSQAPRLSIKTIFEFPEGRIGRVLFSKQAKLKNH